MSDVAQILSAIEAGDPRAASELFPLVYEELRKLAAAQMAGEKPGHALEATALVHEAYLRLLTPARSASDGIDYPDYPVAGAPGSGGAPGFANRRHFVAAAADAMRHILVDAARRRQSQKRGGDLERRDLDDMDLAIPEPREDLVALDDALKKLTATDPQAAELVQLRYFAGFTLLDAAEILHVSPRTAHRLWAYARAFLHRELAS